MSCRFGWHGIGPRPLIDPKVVESKHGRMKYKPQYVDDRFEMLDWSTRKMSLEFYLNVRSEQSMFDILYVSIYT